MRLLIPCALSLLLPGAGWPRFRGPNGAGLGEAKNLPVEFGPGKNMLWRTPLPEGYSSLVLAGPRIYVTAVENEKLFTLALDRASGKILWRREAPRPRKQEIQRANSPVSASPGSDGKNVWVFFQDFGLLAGTGRGALEAGRHAPPQIRCAGESWKATVPMATNSGTCPSARSTIPSAMARHPCSPAACCS